eukprot:TRINITY_DN2464_c0_g2_i1.p1 TRINITY_DN2464_c0_g2~~TRINITY_DN2464_c0_g2_i1.p1  ORF type:complete len:223 (+),score=13.28 TRINITY_DN2464_c0_g2_i1:30-698(+)
MAHILNTHKKLFLFFLVLLFKWGVGTNIDPSTLKSDIVTNQYDSRPLVNYTRGLDVPLSLLQPSNNFIFISNIDLIAKGFSGFIYNLNISFKETEIQLVSKLDECSWDKQIFVCVGNGTPNASLELEFTILDSTFFFSYNLILIPISDAPIIIGTFGQLLGNFAYDGAGDSTNSSSDDTWKIIVGVVVGVGGFVLLVILIVVIIVLFFIKGKSTKTRGAITV